ncbi:MAG: hypothetical protein JWM95_3104 [Gemmatimonadetes bacterium]|nr:hypothetical protein [Gemmatimonadota bacterium]
MRHTVKLAGVIIGYSELEESDASLGRAWGPFRPGPGYELVQPVFQLFREAVPMRGGEPRDNDKLDRYHAARDTMGLSLVDDQGKVIRTSVIHIADYSPVVELDVLITDEDYWASRQ